MDSVTVVKDIEFIQEILKLNDSQFAKKANVSRMSLNRWRNGKPISKDNLEKIYSFAFKSGLRINELKAQLFLDNQRKNEKILFHGARKQIEGNLSIEYSKKNNDFGKAIYAGEDFFQSASFVSNSMNSSVYIIRYKDTKSIKKIEYSVSEDWMLTIAHFRDRLSEYSNSDRLKLLIRKVENADVIIAPIADNQMFSILNDFVNGEITNMQCEKSLSATDLGKQYCFRSSKALKQVEILYECYLCEEEKEYYLNKKYEENSLGMQKVKYMKREYAGKGKYIEELL